MKKKIECSMCSGEGVMINNFVGGLITINDCPACDGKGKFLQEVEDCRVNNKTPIKKILESL